MKIQLEKMLVRIIVWLVAEIVLSSQGIDNLADYSEFIFEHRKLEVISAKLLVLK